MRKIVTTMLLILMIAGGAGLLLYPTVSNLLAQANQSTAIQHYKEAAQGISPEVKAEELAKAQAYNDALHQSTVSDPFGATGGPGSEAYYKILDLGGVMGYIEIPKLDVHLPIYHGTDEYAISHGAGHLADTSLPIGGPNTHSVISSHRGLPAAKLFTDLDKLVIGDTFSVFVLGDELLYQVDDIQIVEPWETEALSIFPGKDYLTLLTCHPYGINSHRMLIRGERIPLPEVTEDTPAPTPVVTPVVPAFRWEYTAAIGAAVVAVAGLGLLLALRGRNRRVKASRKWMDDL